MRRVVIKAAIVVALVVLSACTPFFYGGVVVFGPAGEATPAEAGKGQAAP
jgi:hypothetical protein